MKLTTYVGMLNGGGGTIEERHRDEAEARAYVQMHPKATAYDLALEGNFGMDHAIRLLRKVRPQREKASVHFGIKVTERQYRLLVDVAKGRGISISKVLRSLIDGIEEQ